MDAAVAVIRIDFLEDALRPDLAAAQRRQHVLDVRKAEPSRRGWKCLPAEGLAGLLEAALQGVTAEPGILAAGLAADRPADGGAGLAGHHHRFPRGGRLLDGGAHDLDFVTVLQRLAERRELAVDLRADAGVADLGVHRISEIDRSSAAGQRDQASLRREAEDLV